MAVSVFDLFKIGVGPSSSHTVGPMKAARMFAAGLEDAGTLADVATIECELFGSLGLTGKGHGSDKAVLLGLEGAEPDSVAIESIEPTLERIRAEQRIHLMGKHAVPFVEKQRLLFRKTSLPYHPNGMRFSAYNKHGDTLASHVYYSVG